MAELSIIIPSYDRASRLRACLDALSRQTQPARDFEVIVVVDGSTDETMAMLEELDTPYKLRAVWQENAGQASARNRGITEATGRYCLFLDDDIMASSELIAEHLRAQRGRECIVGIGQLTITLSPEADEFSRLFAEDWQHHYDALNQQDVSPCWEDCYSGNLSAPREILVACGGFATDLARGEDVELGYRLWKMGCTFVYLPKATGCQDERKDFHELSRDAENSGAADVAFYANNPDMLTQALGSFCAGGWRKLLLRRLLLTMRVAPRLLAWIGRAIRKPSRRRSWNGFIRHLCYWRGVRRATAGTDLWLRITSGTPILLFHAVGDPAERATAFLMPSDRFAAHLRWIKCFGFKPITLDEFLACRRQHRFPAARSVVITFDDGYVDNYTRALPLLGRHGMPATVFLVTNYVGATNQWDEAGELAGRPLMDWTQIEEMEAQGIGFGAHSRTHAALTAIRAPEAAAEIAGSRFDIEQALDRSIEAFAYPFGLHDPTVQRLVTEAGYSAALTVDAGLNCISTPASALHRSEIWGTDSVVRLWLALVLGDAEAIWRRNRS